MVMCLQKENRHAGYQRSIVSLEMAISAYSEAFAQ